MNNKRLSIHLTSDTHLEFSDFAPEPCVADVGIFAGDIGIINDESQLFDFFVEMKKRYEYVIWILGNHEFYHSDYKTALNKAKILADDLGIHLMDIEFGTENLELDGVKFWGTTFWTDCNNNDWFAVQKIKNGLNDFHVIKDGDNKFTIQKMMEINKKSREMINWDADVIITHHVPFMIKHPKFDINETTYAFCNTGLHDTILDSNVKLWLFGHNHYNVDLDLNGTRVVSNCHGYKSRYNQNGDVDDYNPDLILEI